MVNYFLRNLLQVVLLFVLIIPACSQKQEQKKEAEEAVGFGKAQQTIEHFYQYLMDANIKGAQTLLNLRPGHAFEWPGNAPVKSYKIIDQRVLSEDEAVVMEKVVDPQAGDVMMEVVQKYVGGNHHIYTYWLREENDTYKIIDYEAWISDGYESKIALDTFVDDVERMAFKEGATDWYIESEIVGFQVKDYMFTARKGQKLTIKLNSDDPYTRFGLFLQRDKKSLNSLRMFKGKNEWSGQIPGDGDYRIRVYLKKKEAKKEHKAHYSLFVDVM